MGRAGDPHGTGAANLSSKPDGILMSQTRKAQEYKLLDVLTGEERGQLKRFGGSEHDDFNYTLMKQAQATPYRGVPRCANRTGCRKGPSGR
jgi:hypothetical protein